MAALIINDPTGERYGFPTYRWGDAPSHLMTRRQLAAAGLRKGGQDPVAELRDYVGAWHRAYLYDSRTALPRRPWTPAKQAAVLKAAAARKKCRGCATQLAYVPARDSSDCEHCNPAYRWEATRTSDTRVALIGSNN
jgi:hypothetical protein